ncbi:MAG: hypothetical protein WDN04_20125 [Rhodospirillales bacterium]
MTTSSAGLVASTERDTKIIMRPLRNTARVLRNEISKLVAAIEARETPVTFEQIRDLVSGLRGRRALEDGLLQDGIIWAGLSVGLIDDIPPATRSCSV